MISFRQASALLYRQSYYLESESVPLRESSGRFLAEPVASPVDAPPFDKAAMDGYAVPASEKGVDSTTADYEILETVAAGESPTHILQPGTAIKIMTGAMIPEGTERIVRVEYTEERAGRMRILTPEPYTNIIRRGENLKAGDEFMRPRRLASRDVGSLAASGFSRVLVRRRLKVGILSTGSELREPGEALAPGEIYNSNGPQLAAQLEAAGAQVVEYETIADTVDACRLSIGKALTECDILLLSGGVSMGDFDFVPGVLEELGVEPLFHGVAIKPGRPVLFGRLGTESAAARRFVFGLPGNPVSVYILFEVMVKPFIYHLNSVACEPVAMRGSLQQELRRKDAERVEFRPVRMKTTRDGLVVDVVRYGGSSHLNALAEADALAVLEPGVSLLPQGAMINVRPL